jgi:hypothetical protein
MVRKIKKKFKKGSGGTVAVPMVMVLTGLYGSRLKEGDLRRPFESPGAIRAVLESHLGQRVTIAERPLSPEEFRRWEFRTAPGRLAGRYSMSDFIPIDPPVEKDDADGPAPGILPFLVLAKGRELASILQNEPSEFSEINRVAFQRAVAVTFNLIPGFDQLLWSPPVHAKQLNGAFAVLDSLVKEAFDRADVACPGPFQRIKEEVLSAIPVSEPLSE